MSLQSTLLETQAKEQYEEGKYLEAYQLLQEAITIDGDNMSLLENALYLARDYLRLPEDIIGIANQMIAIDGEHTSALIQRAWAYYDTQQITEALKDFEQAMLLSPSQEDMLYIRSGRGLCYYFINQYDEAIIDLQAGIAVYDKWAVGFAYLGWSLYHIKQYESAKKHLTQAIELSDGTYPFAHGGRGLINYELEIYDEAIEDLTIGLSENTDWAPGYATRGWSYYSIPYYQDKIELALADFNTAIEKSDDQYLFAYAGRGLIKYDQNLYQEAIADLEIALVENKEWTKGFSTLGWAYLENSEIEKALENFNIALKLSDGENLFALGGRGLAYYELQKYEEAITDLKATLTENEEWSRGYATLGWCQYELANSEPEYQEALASFNTAMELAENTSAFAQGGRALVYQELSEFDKAIEALDDTFLEEQAWTRGYGVRGWCKYEIAESDEDYLSAIEDLTKAMELSEGKYVYAQSGRAMSYYYMDKATEAIADFLEVMPEYPEWIMGHKALGYCYYRNKDYQKALEEYDIILALKPDDWDAHSRKGLIYEALKEYDKNAEEYQKAIALGGKSCVKGNLAELYRLGRGMDEPLPQQAFNLYLEAYAEQEETRSCGCITAQLMDCYYRGIGTRENHPEVLCLLEHGVEIENDSTYFAYLQSYFYATGNIVTQDIAKAIQLLEKMQESEAENRLGWYNLYVLYTKVGDAAGAKKAKSLADATELDLEDEFIEDVEKGLTAEKPELIYPFK